jgi:acyl carrier protein
MIPDVLDRATQNPESGDLAAALIGFIHDELPKVHARTPAGLQIDRETLLFESGLIDSLAILHLMAVVERWTGRKIPPRMVVMKHFRSIDAICRAFAQPTGEHCDAND